MLIFENGLHIGARKVTGPQVAKFHVGGGVYRYCVIGTLYGYIHTASGDVRTWLTANGARRFIRSYQPY